MPYSREPLLHTVPIAALRPTQITVGLREVKEKQKHWKRYDADKQAAFLGNHMIPVIYGPEKLYFVIDHHHLARALQDAGQKDILVTVIKDISRLTQDEFWCVLDHHAWVHPYDATGVRRDYKDIPKRISNLKDDPYRSLAGALRRIGGYAKDTTPFSEFLWADFLRRRLKKKAVEDDYDASLKKAFALAKETDADYLPGWCGPVAQ